MTSTVVCPFPNMTHEEWNEYKNRKYNFLEIPLWISLTSIDFLTIHELFKTHQYILIGRWTNNSAHRDSTTSWFQITTYMFVCSRSKTYVIFTMYETNELDKLQYQMFYDIEITYVNRKDKHMISNRCMDIAPPNLNGLNGGFISWNRSSVQMHFSTKIDSTYLDRIPKNVLTESFFSYIQSPQLYKYGEIVEKMEVICPFSFNMFRYLDDLDKLKIFIDLFGKINMNHVVSERFNMISAYFSERSWFPTVLVGIKGTDRNSLPVGEPIILSEEIKKILFHSDNFN